MRNVCNILLALLCFCGAAVGQTDDSLCVHRPELAGELSGYMHYNKLNAYPLSYGGRYIPRLNEEVTLPGGQRLDFEASASLWADGGFYAGDSVHGDAGAKLHRLWGRWSGEQFELRAGLQKLNFGSATMLRPLMWFDQVDPRDPLGYTDGVYGVLFRYYFLNNANVWLWSLYGNEQLRGWDVTPTRVGRPEYGGRVQLPLPQGEVAVTGHYREADYGGLMPGSDAMVSEERLGVDLRMDTEIGWWVEGSWIRGLTAPKALRSQTMINVGADYTFDVGNGLAVTVEHLLFSVDEQQLAFEGVHQFTAMSAGYPLGMFDDIRAIAYYDWAGGGAFNFINWQRQFNRFALHVMAYWNPEGMVMPAQGVARNLYGGKGIQIMLVYNH